MKMWDGIERFVKGKSAALAGLKEVADEWLEAPPLSVLQKKRLAPSGDPHDYVSMGAYLWPDATKPDGLPYLNRDGEVNPEFYEYDSVALECLVFAVQHLALYAVAADSPRHADQAGRLLRTWFIHPETRMNPHLNYGQFAPGRNEGSPFGIIDTTSLIFLVQAIGRLPFGAEWSADDLAALRDWFSEYLNWLLTSDFGRAEGGMRNNHGSWYDAQVGVYAGFCGRPEVAARQIERQTPPRLLAQILPNGEQPHELARTLALTYCHYNLLAHACSAEVGRHLGIDLWSPSGRGEGRLLQGLKWLQPFQLGQEEWRYSQIHPFDFTAAAPLLYLAWLGTSDEEFLRRCGHVAPMPWQWFIFSKAALTGRKYPIRRGGGQAKAK